MALESHNMHIKTDFLLAAGVVTAVVSIGLALGLPVPAIIGGSVASLSGPFFRAVECYRRSKEPPLAPDQGSLSPD
jgi:hypothetical protein